MARLNLYCDYLNRNVAVSAEKREMRNSMHAGAGVYATVYLHPECQEKCGNKLCEQYLGGTASYLANPNT
jgi:hypothetical protein